MCHAHLARLAEAKLPADRMVNPKTTSAEFAGVRCLDRCAIDGRLNTVVEPEEHIETLLFSGTMQTVASVCSASICTSIYLDQRHLRSRPQRRESGPRDITGSRPCTTLGSSKGSIRMNTPDDVAVRVARRGYAVRGEITCPPIYVISFPKKGFRSPNSMRLPIVSC